MRVLYEDNHLVAVFKQAGTLVQGDRSGDVSLLDLVKDYLKRAYDKPGNVFLGLVHRLDRPVSGVVMFARTSKSASRLASQFKQRSVKKTYLAIVEGRIEGDEGIIESFLHRDGQRSTTVAADDPRGRQARLTFCVIDRNPNSTLVEVNLESGRHHQIRVQFADSGHAVVGDVKYGAQIGLDKRAIALHAYELVVRHPTRDEAIRVTAPPPPGFPWQAFETSLKAYC